VPSRKLKAQPHSRVIAAVVGELHRSPLGVITKVIADDGSLSIRHSAGDAAGRTPKKPQQNVVLLVFGFVFV
jgi:hypothetical protein